MTHGAFAYAQAVKKGADAVIFFDEINRRYVSGFPASDGIAVCHAGGTSLLLDMRYALSAERAKDSGTLPRDVEVVRCEGRSYSDLDSFLVRRGIKTALLESTAVTIDAHSRLKKELPEVKFVPTADICGDCRRIKDAGEIACIKAAQEITDKAFSHILGFISRGMSERQVATELDFYMKSCGADGSAFETIAVSGLKSALPHGVPDDTLLSENAFFTMDLARGTAAIARI